ncbi:MAG: glycosyltransferase family 4 protein [Chloroflexota bacterium]|nr:glycosyltransferase family 4 protein [Chloroflexota bacterium]
MVRIAMMGDYPRDPEHVGGGVEAVTLYLLGELQRFDDLELHMITMRPDVKEKVVCYDRTTVHYIATNYRRNALTLDSHHRRLLRQKLTALQPDLVHAHIAGTYHLATLGMGFPTVLTLHGVRRNETALWRGWRSQLYRRWVITYQEWASVRAAEHVIAISPYIRREFGRTVRGQIYDIENPICDRFFAIERREQPNRVLYAGHISVRKGILELLQAVNMVRQRIPDLQVRLAGRMSSDQTYIEQVRSYVRDHSLEDCIRFLGPLDEKNLLDEYARCTLLVLPSRQETAPMVIEEAMAARVPVVATRVGGVQDLVSDGRTGFVVELGDTKGLADAMVRTLADADLRARMGEAGRIEADRRFRADAVACQTRKVYDQILNHSSALSRVEVE